MLRNMRGSNVSNIPSVHLGRSRFPKQWTDSTDISQGQFVPIAVIPTVPGGTYSYNIGNVLRMATPIFPVMDDAEISYGAWYTPYRVVWPHFKELIGANESGHFAPDVSYRVPALKFDQSFDPDGLYGASPGSLANRLYRVRRIPGDKLQVSDLWNRAYRMIWNEYMRSDPYQDPVFVPTDDQDRSYYDDVGDGTAYGYDILRVCRLPDYFSQVLPEPQSGAGVEIPIGGVVSITTSAFEANTNGLPGMRVRTSVNTVPQDGALAAHSGVVQTTDLSGTFRNSVVPSNLVADLSKLESFGTSNMGTISELRTAFQLQKLLEAYARGGRRYRSILENVYGVRIPDSTVQIPELLGVVTRPINMAEVIQQSQSTDTSPMGSVSAVSRTQIPVDRTPLFNKSTDEHGVIIVCAWIRVRHTYSQAMPHEAFQFQQSDFWFPQFNAISDQPILSREFHPVGGAADDTVFGYSPAWEFMRTHLNTVSGLFTPDHEGISYLRAWSYADVDQDVDPAGQGYVANDEWLTEPSDNISQTIALPNEPQFILNTGFRGSDTLPIPVYGIPGLADHF